MDCQLQVPPSDVFDTAGNRGAGFPNLQCPVETATQICPLILQEGEENILFLETGDFLLIPCEF